jgi:hypothetical protein
MAEVPFGIQQNTPCAVLFTPGFPCGEKIKKGMELVVEGTGADIQQRSAHENPVIFYSMAIGFLGKSIIQTSNLNVFQLDIMRTLLLDWRAMGYPRGLLGHDGMSANGTGPTMVLTVPPIRKSFGWKPAERIPTTFPCTLIMPP